jgi:hypothetical protein
MSTDLPRCPDHGDLVRDLALGLLEGDRAMEAECVRLSCDHCRTWWASALSGPATGGVEDAVAAAFRSVSLTRARRRDGWKVVAAAAACVAIIGVAGLLHQGPSTTDIAHQAPQPISILDFENAPVAIDDPATEGALFVSDLEDGTLTNWS